MNNLPSQTIILIIDYTFISYFILVPAIYNIQVAFRKEDPPATLTNILKRQSLRGYMYIQRVPMKDIPKEDDQQISNFLLDIYKQKVCQRLSYPLLP